MFQSKAFILHDETNPDEPLFLDCAVLKRVAMGKRFGHHDFETKGFGNVLTALIDDPSWQALMPFRIGFALREALASSDRAVVGVLI